jgi:hypothetical protein
VIFGRFSGTDVELNGERLLMLREDDVVAAIRPDDGSGNLAFTPEMLEPAKTPEQEELPDDVADGVDEDELQDANRPQNISYPAGLPELGGGEPGTFPRVTPETETREEFRARMRRLAEGGEVPYPSRNLPFPPFTDRDLVGEEGE